MLSAPDLTVQSISGPTSAKTGETVLVTATIQNAHSGGDAGFFQVETQLVGTTWGVWILDRSTASGLAAGESITVGGSGQIPLGLPDQSYYLRAVADFTNKVVETDETNNTLQGNDVQIVRPDLTVTAVSGPTSAKTGERVSVTATVQNSLSGGEAGFFKVETRLVGSIWGAWVLDRSNVFGLAPGQSIDVVGSGEIPLGLPDQSYYLQAIADSSKDVVESDETNNTLRGNDISINNRPPVIAAVTNNGPVNEGSLVTVTVNASDPDDDALVYRFDFDGDGVYELSNNSGEAEHIYADNRDYVVNVEVFDGIDGVATSSTTVSVTNVSPSVGELSAPDALLQIGALFNVSLDFSDPGFDTPTSVEDFTTSTIGWGDGIIETVPLISLNEVPGSPGVFTTGTISASHAYAEGGIYTITATVRDDDGGANSATAIVYVTGVGLHNGVLQIVGTSGADQVHLETILGDIEVETPFTEPSLNYFSTDDVNSIQIVLADGDDHVNIDSSIDEPATIEAGSGHDNIHAGSGRTTVYGGAGNDQIFGGFSQNLLFGESGDDLLQGRDGNDILIGGDGNDSLSGGDGVDILIGGAGADQLLGGLRDDLLIGGWTAFDNDEVALRAIQAEWTNPNHDRDTRIANLTGDDSNPAFADRLNGDYFLKTEGFDATVFDDDELDSIFETLGDDWWLSE